MRILIVSATAFEVPSFFGLPGDAKEGITLSYNGSHETTVLITGIGQARTTWHLGRHLLSHNYDLAVNIGICGVFNREMPLGEVVNVIKDCFADLGAEDDAGLLDLFDIRLSGRNDFPFSEGWLSNTPVKGWFSELREVTGISVNRSSGNDNTIEKLYHKYRPDIESFEGAAFFYGCHLHGIRAMQIRALSNYVEKRNRAGWEIEKALSNLHAVIQTILK